MNAVKSIPSSLRHRSPQLVSPRPLTADEGAATRCLEGLLEAAPEGVLTTSLARLGSLYPQFGVSGLRAAAVRLDRCDHRISVNPDVVGEDVEFRIVWAPVTAVVDLMLDWDLLRLEISIVELATWLGTSVPVAQRAVDYLADFEGIEVAQWPGVATLRVTIDPLRCPLMEPVRSIA